MNSVQLGKIATSASSVHLEMDFYKIELLVQWSYLFILSYILPSLISVSTCSSPSFSLQMSIKMWLFK